MKVSIIGQGYVGLTISVGAANAGHQVNGFDIDDRLIQNLAHGVTFVPGILKSELLELQSSNKLKFSNEPSSFSNSEIIVIAVPTPLDQERNPDLEILSSAVNMVSKNLKTNSLIINESTSYPGTLRNLIKPIFDKNSTYRFEFASAPERVDPGNENWNLENTPRVVAGLTPEATLKVKEFYSSFCKIVIESSTPEVAEASKLFENTFRQVNIALANEFSEIANALGFSASEAIHAASTKPFGFMPFYPSIGVGGHCIPVDPSYLTYSAEIAGFDAKFIKLASQVNFSKPNVIKERIKDYLGGDLGGKKLQVAGISYKPDVSDLRESPALDLIKELENDGAIVSWHDPFVNEYNGKQSVKLSIDIDLGLIVTPHSQIDFSFWKKANVKVIDLSANSNNYGWPKFL